MTSLANGLASRSVRRHVTFGVSRLWIPHVALIHFIYYVFFSPQQYSGQNALWTFGTFIRVFIGGKPVNIAVAFMWIVHVFEAAYTITLARRYETTFVVGLSYVLATLLFGRPRWEELSNRAQESLQKGKAV